MSLTSITSFHQQLPFDKSFYLVLIFSLAAACFSFPREIWSIITTKDSHITEYNYNDDLDDGGIRAKEEAILFDGWVRSEHGLTLNPGQSGVLIYKFSKSPEQLVFLRLWFYKWEGVQTSLTLAKGQDEGFQDISINHHYKGQVIDLTKELLGYDDFRIKLQAQYDDTKDKPVLVIADKIQVFTKNPSASLPAIPLIFFTFSLPLFIYHLMANSGTTPAKAFYLALGIALFLATLKHNFYPQLIYHLYLFLITWGFEFSPEPFSFSFLRIFEYGSTLFFILLIASSILWLAGTPFPRKIGQARRPTYNCYSTDINRSGFQPDKKGIFRRKTQDYLVGEGKVFNKSKIFLRTLAILLAGLVYGFSLEIIDSPKQDLSFLTHSSSQINSLIFSGIFLSGWLTSAKLISYHRKIYLAKALKLSALPFYLTFLLTLLFLPPLFNLRSEYLIFLVILVTSMMIALQARQLLIPNDQYITPWESKHGSLCLSGLMSLYFIIFVSLKFRLYDYVKLGLRDLTIFDQALWNIAHNGSFQSSVLGKNIFAEHSHFLLMLLVPIYRFFPSPKILLVLQCLSLALGALPLYLLAKEMLRSQKAPLILAACYLLYPSLSYLNMDMVIFGFHPDSFLPTIILFSFYFAVRNKNSLYFCSMMAAFLIKENTPMVYTLLGCYFFLFLRKRTLGLITIIFSLFWYKFMVEMIIPSMLQVPVYSIGFYSALGSNAFEIISKLIYNPLTALKKLWNADISLYLPYLLVPIGFLPVLCPEVMLITIPTIVLNLLAEYISIRVDSWHIATIIPFISIASIIAMKRIERLWPSMTNNILIFIFSTSLLSQYYLGLTPFSKHFWNYNYVLSKREGPTYQYSQYLPSSRENIVNEVKRYIPDTAPLSTSFYLGSHFSYRKEIYWFPQGEGKVNYILLDKEYDTGPTEIWQAKRNFITVGYKKKGFDKVYVREGVYLFQRIKGKLRDK